MLVEYLKVIIMVIIWSLSFVVVDIAIVYMAPLSIALYRFIIASLTFLILDIFQKLQSKESRKEFQNKSEKYTRHEWLLLIFSSLTGVSFFFFAQYTAIDLIGPSLPALVVCLLCPIIITILSLVFFEEKLTKIKILGFVISTVGAFLLLTGGDMNSLLPTSPNFMGLLFALLTPFFWAFYTTATKKIVKTKDPIRMLKYISYFGTIELFIFVLISGQLPNFIGNFLNGALFISALYLGLGCYILGYFIWNTSNKKMKSSKLSSFLYIEPFITLIFSIIFQRSETIVLWNILGGLIVLGGVLIINYK